MVERLTLLKSSAGSSLHQIKDKIINQEAHKSDVAHLSMLKECLVKYDGNKKLIRRLYCSYKDPGERYATVGWVLDKDVDRCMVCGLGFNFTRSRHHCRACGNLVCSSCSSSAIVEGFGKVYPQIACKQCNWGQDVVKINPTATHGLPVCISKKLETGFISILKPAVVIKCRKPSNHARICVNLGFSHLVPHNKLNLSPPGATRKHLIYMSSIPSETAIDGVLVYTVAVNIAEISKFHGVDKNDKESELIVQVVAFISRLEGEDLSSEVELEPRLTFYNPELTTVENQRIADSMVIEENDSVIRRKSGSSEDVTRNSKDLRLLKVMVPGESAFTRYFQIPCPLHLDENKRHSVNSQPENERSASTRRISHVGGYMKDDGIKAINKTPSKLETTPSKTENPPPKAEKPHEEKPPEKFVPPMLSSTSRSDNNSIAPIKTGRAVSRVSFDKISDLADSPRSGEPAKGAPYLSPETLERQQLKFKRESELEKLQTIKLDDSLSDRQSMISAITVESNLSAVLPHERSNTRQSIAGFTHLNAELYKGQAGLTEEMMVYDKEKSINADAIEKLKAESTRRPRALEGWQVLLFGDNMEVAGIAVVTGVRKNISRQSEFRLSTTDFRDVWLRLKRSEKKGGVEFQPLRKVLDKKRQSLVPFPSVH